MPAAPPPELDAESRALETALLDWITAAPAGFVGGGATRAARYGLTPLAASALEQEFETLALRLFAYQYERCDVYRAFARAAGATPSLVRRARDVPALPVEALRRWRVASFPLAAERARFHTSGTTDRPGTLVLDSLALYDLTLVRGFAHHVVPDLERLRMFLLVPPWEETPHSSLGYMLERVRQRWGTTASAHYVRGGKLLWGDLQRDLADAARDAAPVCVLATTFALVEALDAAAAASWSVHLPARSRVFETGGTKGRTRAVAPAALRAELERRLGVPATHVVSEYGMTELASQYYTLSLRQALLQGAAAATSLWSAPFWLRPRILDTDTGTCRELDEPGGLGLLAHQDLGNRSTVAHFLTADVGAPGAGTFELHGRCPRSDLRGCGLVAEGLERVEDADGIDTVPGGTPPARDGRRCTP